ncbi:MAG: RNA methyltransferase [Bacteroidales bacterium]|nr:RNA methyltransferase [Bacteroidales bacterium]
MELSKNKIKYFCSFSKKKIREEEHKFIVEGNKLVEELLHSDFKIECVVATKQWIDENQPQCDFYIANHEDISKISLLQNPQDVWALVNCKQSNSEINTHGLVLALDGIQDPGNMGTIIRLADWFGISQIICSNECVEIYNPKVVQATMGSIFRINVNYVDLPAFLKNVKNTEIFSADMAGENVYTAEIPENAILVMGNEGNGISDEVSQLANRTIHIPSFNKTGKTSESLNVAVATAILCSEFRRKTV